MQLDLLRGDLEDPAVGEYVPTPRWVVRDLLDTPGVCVPRRGRKLRVLDACAGLGQIGRAFEALAVQGLEGDMLERCRPQMAAVELHPERLERCPEHWARCCADIVEWCAVALAAGVRFDLVLCNPPFSFYFEIAEALLKVRHPVDGQVWLVGPVGHTVRPPSVPWWEAHPPEWILPLRRRPWPKNTRECAWVGWAPRTTATKWRWAGVPR